MTCKDCIHFDVCEKSKHIENYRIQGCKDFKDKADFVEVKHGKWVKENNKRTCSECGYYYFGNSTDTNYCPNCGAKMDGR